MISKKKLANSLSLTLAVILLMLAFTVTLIAIFFPGDVNNPNAFNMSEYEAEYGTPGAGAMPDLNGIIGDLNGGCDGEGGGGGGDIDLSRVVFKVFATENATDVYFRQGSYVLAEGNVWYEATPFESKTYPDIDATYFSGQYILKTTSENEKTMMFESLDGTVVMPYYATGGLDVPETVIPYAEENYKYTTTYVDYSKVKRNAKYAKYAEEYTEFAYNTYLS